MTIEWNQTTFGQILQEVQSRSYESAFNAVRHLKPTVKQPRLDVLERQMDKQGLIRATDGCMVEVDGDCRHGHVSWLRYLGWI